MQRLYEYRDHTYKSHTISLDNCDTAFQFARWLCPTRNRDPASEIAAVSLGTGENNGKTFSGKIVTQKSIDFYNDDDNLYNYPMLFLTYSSNFGGIPTRIH